MHTAHSTPHIAHRTLCTVCILLFSLLFSPLVDVDRRAPAAARAFGLLAAAAARALLALGCHGDAVKMLVVGGGVCRWAGFGSES